MLRDWGTDTACIRPPPRALNFKMIAGSYSLLKSHGKYGFIKQVSGEDTMFVMPKACVGFYGQFPEPGTRLSYNIVLDERTGHPRAEDVNPLAEASFSPASRRPPPSNKSAQTALPAIATTRASTAIRKWARSDRAGSWRPSARSRRLLHSTPSIAPRIRPCWI